MNEAYAECSVESSWATVPNILAFDNTHIVEFAPVVSQLSPGLAISKVKVSPP